MTENAAALHRPSPRPRPAGAPAHPEDAPTLRIVPPAPDPITDSDGETCIAGPEDAHSERRSPVSRLSTLKSAITTGSNRLSGLVAASTAYWTPPRVFTDRPASLADLAEYAQHAPWTAQKYVAQPHTDETTKKQVKTGPIRAAGIWYYRGVGYPYTVLARYTEWFAQRPMRAVVLLGGIKLAALTGPGDWVVHTVIYPAAHLAGHILL